MRADVAIAAKRLRDQGGHRDAGRRSAGEDEGTRAEGAEIIFYDGRPRAGREIAARQLRTKPGQPVVPSFDDPRFVAGPGHPPGLEILDHAGRGVRS
jgi:threonine dehydratase